MNLHLGDAKQRQHSSVKRPIGTLREEHIGYSEHGGFENTCRQFKRWYRAASGAGDNLNMKLPLTRPVELKKIDAL